LYINLSHSNFASLAEAKKAGASTINYGLFINNLIDFLIMAAIIFLVIRFANRMMNPRGAAAAKPKTKACSLCLMDVPILAQKCGHCTSAIS